MPRRIPNPRHDGLSEAQIDQDLKRVKLAIEREKLCHLKVKTAQFPKRFLPQGPRNHLAAQNAPDTGAQDANLFQRCLQLSLTDPKLLPALFKYRREHGCDDSQFLTDELIAQCDAQLDALGA